MKSLSFGRRQSLGWSRQTFGWCNHWPGARRGSIGLHTICSQKRCLWAMLGWLFESRMWWEGARGWCCSEGVVVLRFVVFVQVQVNLRIFELGRCWMNLGLGQCKRASLVFVQWRCWDVGWNTVYVVLWSTY